MINTYDNPCDPIPAVDDVYRTANNLIARHGNRDIGGYGLRPGAAIRIAICSMGYGWPRDDRDIVRLAESDKMLLPRIESLFGGRNDLFPVYLHNDIERIVTPYLKGEIMDSEMMDERECEVFYDCAQKILDGLAAGMIGLSDESDLEKIVMKYISDDPRLATYDKGLTARKIVRELLG